MRLRWKIPGIPPGGKHHRGGEERGVYKHVESEVQKHFEKKWEHHDQQSWTLILEDSRKVAALHLRRGAVRNGRIDSSDGRNGGGARPSEGGF